MSAAVWCMVDLAGPVGMETRSIHQPGMLVVAIPVMPFERLLTLDHLSTDEAPPVVLPQDRGPHPRRRLLCSLAVTVLNGRLPGRIAGVGVPFDLNVALRPVSQGRDRQRALGAVFRRDIDAFQGRRPITPPSTAARNRRRFLRWGVPQLPSHPGRLLAGIRGHPLNG